jgi:hypothetical protein
MLPVRGLPEAELSGILPPRGGARPWPLIHRAGERTWRGEARRRAGLDPWPAWGGAKEDLDLAIRLDPKIPDPWIHRAELLLLRANHLAGKHRRAAAQERSSARENLAHALALDPTNPKAQQLRAVASDLPVAATPF